MTEEEMVVVEEDFPNKAEALFKKVFEEAIVNGQKVLVTENGALIEVSLEGRRKIKDIEPPTPVTQRRFVLCRK
jgi:hypothetical protein